MNELFCSLFLLFFSDVERHVVHGEAYGGGIAYTSPRYLPHSSPQGPQGGGGGGNGWASIGAVGGGGGGGAVSGGVLGGRGAGGGSNGKGRNTSKMLQRAQQRANEIHFLANGPRV